jgi:hypothetical protein
VAIFVFGGAMHWKIKSGATMRVVTMAFAAMAVLVPSARSNDSPKKGESTRGDDGKGGTDDIGGGCQDNRNNGAAQESIERGGKRNLFRAWLDLGEQVQAKQPDWLSPLATTSGRLKQEFRYDIWDQPAGGGNRSYQFGGSKGLEFITSSRTQILIGVPTYTLVSPNGPPSGFGDLPLMLKFRISSAERAEGNYLVTFLLVATAPTGSRRYGAGDAVLTPTMALGKGWRRFDVQSTLGVNLPAADTAKLGRQLLWNTAFQYRAAWKLWPELEANSTFYTTGKYAGETQLFLTPGLGIGRAHLAGPFRLSAAVGMQIAATQFHTYNHRWMLSTRVSF